MYRDKAQGLASLKPGEEQLLHPVTLRCPVSLPAQEDLQGRAHRTLAYIPGVQLRAIGQLHKADSG